VPAVEDRVDRRDGVNTDADEQVPQRVDRPIPRGTAGDDLEDPERPVIDFLVDTASSASINTTSGLSARDRRREVPPSKGVQSTRTVAA